MKVSEVQNAAGSLELRGGYAANDAAPAAGARRNRQSAAQGPFFLGVDVGSTTVKVVACAQSGTDLLFQLYRRHESRQRPPCWTRCASWNRRCPSHAANTRLFVTGSGGARIARDSGRQVCAGGDGGQPGRGAPSSTGALGDRTGRAGFQDHRLPGKHHPRPSQEVRLHERQVRRRHRAR